jgi:hypothetical protein
VGQVLDFGVWDEQLQIAIRLVGCVRSRLAGRHGVGKFKIGLYWGSCIAEFVESRELWGPAWWVPEMTSAGLHCIIRALLHGTTASSSCLTRAPIKAVCTCNSCPSSPSPSHTCACLLSGSPLFTVGHCRTSGSAKPRSASVALANPAKDLGRDPFDLQARASDTRR